MNPLAVQSPEESVRLYSFFTNWRTPVREGYSHDQLIDAYLTGMEHAKTEEKRLLGGIFQNNLEHAMKFSEEKFQALMKIFDVTPVGMRMSVIGISSFETLLILSRDNYQSSKIESIYGYLLDEMRKVNNEQFNWTFILMPSLGDLNEEAISLDGYSLMYANPA